MTGPSGEWDAAAAFRDVDGDQGDQQQNEPFDADAWCAEFFRSEGQRLAAQRARQQPMRDSLDLSALSGPHGDVWDEALRAELADGTPGEGDQGGTPPTA